MNGKLRLLLLPPGLLVAGAVAAGMLSACRSREPAAGDGAARQEPGKAEEQTARLELSSEDSAFIRDFRSKVETFPGSSIAEARRIAEMLLRKRATLAQVEALLGKPSCVGKGQSFLNLPEGHVLWYGYRSNLSLGLAFDKNGVIQAANAMDNKIVKVTPSGEIEEMERRKKATPEAESKK